MFSEMNRAVELSASANNRASLAYAYAIAGERAKAQSLLAELEAAPQERQPSPYLIAAIHAGLGRRDEAFNWLEEAYHRHSVFLIYLNVIPVLDDLRADARFKAMAQRIGLAD